MLTLNDIPGEWVRYAACDLYTAEEFFRGSNNPSTQEEKSARFAKEICGRCGVRDQCLEWVLADDEKRIARRESTNAGVWGATTQKERQQMRKGKR